jgi:hypothetical protein
MATWQMCSAGPGVRLGAYDAEGGTSPLQTVTR